MHFHFMGRLCAAWEFVLPGSIRTRHFVGLIPDPPLRGDPFSHPSGSGAPREVFAFIKSFPSLSFPSLAAPNPLWRVQKTFSSGPCSFSLKNRGSQTWVRAQPVFDSRHGRITGKSCSRSL